MNYARARYAGYAGGVAVVVAVGFLATSGQYVSSGTSVTVSAAGTVNAIPKFSGASTLATGIATDNGTLFAVSGALSATNTTAVNNGFSGTNTIAGAASNQSAVRGANTSSLDCTGTRTAYGGNFSAAVTESVAGTSIAIGVSSTASGADVNVAYEGVAGNNYFNTSSGNTCIGIATAGTCAAKLTLTGNATVSTTLAVAGNATLGDNTADTATTWGHMIVEGTAPAPSSCGGSPSVVGTDHAFRGVVGSAITTCTWTFQRTHTVVPVCVVRTEGAATQPTCTVSATAITCTVVVASTAYHWVCFTPTGGT